VPSTEQMVHYFSIVTQKGLYGTKWCHRVWPGTPRDSSKRDYMNSSKLNKNLMRLPPNCDQIALESQWRHRRIRKTQTHLSKYVARTSDVILEENPFFTLPKNLVVFIQKAVDGKPNTLEIKFLHKKCQLPSSLFESNRKQWTFLVGISSDNWRANLPFKWPLLDDWRVTYHMEKSYGRFCIYVNSNYVVFRP